MPDSAHVIMFADMMGVEERLIDRWCKSNLHSSKGREANDSEHLVAQKRKKTVGTFVVKSFKEPPGLRTFMLYLENRLASKRFGPGPEPPVIPDAENES